MSLPWLSSVGKSENDAFHWFSAFKVMLSMSTFSPFAKSSTSIESGRFPSWLLPSFQTFFTGMSVLGDTNLFVTVKPSSETTFS